MANILSPERRALILQCLTEGTSVRGAARMANTSIKTVLKLQNDAGRVCLEYQDRHLQELPCSRIEVDEIWTFVYAKEKNKEKIKKMTPAGDVYTWVSICPDTKIVPNWLVADRSSEACILFMSDLAFRFQNRIQLTSDGLSHYINATIDAFGENDVDFAQLIKVVDNDDPAHKVHVLGRPDPDFISTSIVERNNLNMRMSMRRFTRRSNGFSKKLENLAHMVSLNFFHHNFMKRHLGLKGKITPAMAVGLADQPHSYLDLVSLLNLDYEMNRPKTRGPYKKRKGR